MRRLVILLTFVALAACHKSAAQKIPDHTCEFIGTVESVKCGFDGPILKGCHLTTTAGVEADAAMLFSKGAHACECDDMGVFRCESYEDTARLVELAEAKNGQD